MKLNQKKNFTLIEVLVVVGIIGILAGLLLPVFLTARRQARRLSCLNNLKQIGFTMLAYSHAYEHFPRIGSDVNDFPDTIDLESATALENFGIKITNSNSTTWKCPSSLLDPAGQEGDIVRLYGESSFYVANYAVMTNWIGVPAYDNETPDGLSPSTVDPKQSSPLVGDSVSDWTGAKNAGAAGSIINGSHCNENGRSLGANQVFTDYHGKWFTYSQITSNGPRWSENGKKFYWIERD